MRSPQERRNNRQNSQRRNNNQNRMPVHSRQFESAGPDGKLKGTPKQLIEKYMNLARDYYANGDDVNAETCKQFAEHYSRLLGANNNRNTSPPHENDEKTNKETRKIEIEVVETANEKPVRKKRTPKLSTNEDKAVEALKEETAATEEIAENPPKRRGRPKKKSEAEEELQLPLAEIAEEAPKKRRGRPKKVSAE